MEIDNNQQLPAKNLFSIEIITQMCYNSYILLILGFYIMEFKDKVKQVRDTLVLSQAELAKELGVAFASVNRWENGVRVPTYALQRRFYEYCTLKGIVFTENSKKNGD